MDCSKLNNADIDTLNKCFTQILNNLTKGSFIGRPPFNFADLFKEINNAYRLKVSIKANSLKSSFLSDINPSGGSEQIDSYDDYLNFDASCPYGTYYSSQTDLLVGLSGIKPDLNVLKKFSSIYLNSNLINPAETIPYITHHVWITNVNIPKVPSDLNLNITKQTIDNIDNGSSNSWLHYFWTNSVDSIPSEIRNNKKFQIKLIQDFPDLKLIDKINLLSASPYFAIAASDIARLSVLEKFGGLYLDMDYKICKPIDDLINSYDSVFGSEQGYYFGNAFMAAHVSHPIITGALNKISENLDYQTAPEYLKNPCNLFSYVIMATGPLVLATSFYKMADLNGNKDVSLPFGEIYDYPKAKLSNEGKLPAITNSDYCSNINTNAYGNDKYGGSWGTCEHYDSQWLIANRCNVFGEIYPEIC